MPLAPGRCCSLVTIDRQSPWMVLSGQAQSTCLSMMTTEYPTRRQAVWRRASRQRTRCPAVHTECSPRKSARAKDSWPVGSMRQACTRLHTRWYAEHSCSISARVVGTSAGRQSSVRFCGILALCACALCTRMMCARAYALCRPAEALFVRGGAGWWRERGAAGLGTCAGTCEIKGRQAPIGSQRGQSTCGTKSKNSANRTFTSENPGLRSPSNYKNHPQSRSKTHKHTQANLTSARRNRRATHNRPPHLRRDWAHSLPHLQEEWAT